MAQPFPNYLQMRAYLPAWAWGVLRLCGVLAALGMAALLVVQPEEGLPLFWGLIVPALPLVFMLTPGIWRNLCPLATSNQAPRRLGLIRGRAQRSLATGAAFPLGIALFIAAIVARKLLFGASGPATAALIVGAMVAAFGGGLLFKGKSGWCSSICPLLPVQRLYGQTPFIKVANTQCEPCVGCAKNCYDFNPGEAYLADQYDADPRYRQFRRFFAGLFPGLILGFYLVPDLEVLDAGSVVLQMLLYMASSLTLVMLLDLLFKATPNRVPVVCAALAINTYYWFTAPTVLRTLQHLGVPVDPTWVGALRAAVVIASLVWIARSMQAERQFLGEQVRKGQDGEIRLAPVVVETVRLHRDIVPRHAEREVVAAPGPAANAARIQGGDTGPGVLGPPEGVPPSRAAKAPRGIRPELRIEPEGRCLPLQNGSTLLSVLEACGAAIQPGCRAGACGADPIAVTEGVDCLGPIGGTEGATLARLGLASNTRLACMARVRRAGTVVVELAPQPVEAIASAAAPAAAPGSPPAASSAPSAPSGPAAAPHGPADTAGLGSTHLPQSNAVDPSIGRVVIIGNGIAGLTAAETLRRDHPHCEIHLVARERYPAYNRMAVSALINQRAGMQGMALKPEAWYGAQRITQWLNTRATEIDLDGARVLLATGEALPYDRLIVANGSRAWTPPVEGLGIEGSFTLRDADDAMEIRSHAQRHGARSAVVAGAGLLGLEVAAELRKFGMAVRVLSLGDHVLDRQVDAGASALVISHLGRQGITVVRRASLRSLRRREGRVAGVRLEDGRDLATELVVVCAGARAELDLAHAAGLACGRGITVDAQMRTSAENVYAAGDVAEFEGRQFGLWSVAIAQGEVAARSALGLPACYEAAPPVTSLKVSGIEVRSAGASCAERPGQRELRCTGPAHSAGTTPPEGDPPYCKLVVEKRSGQERADRLVGAVIVGPHEAADELLDAARQRATLKSLKHELARHRWLLLSAEPVERVA